jgi:ADP-dependent NAD(P)H-hydrate dehydratase / NAD(P)H-hydrate epimerase
MKMRSTHRSLRRRHISDVLPESVYSVDQVKSMDRHAIDELDVPGYELMCRAARAALQALRESWPLVRRLLVVCGAGNNAGDGYVLARLASRSGYAVQVVAVCEPERLKGDAARAWQDCTAAGVPIEMFSHDTALSPQAEVIVDALLGTGVSRPLSAPFAAAVSMINAAPGPVLALDVPSGLNADTGMPHGPVVKADLTVTFVGLKTGLFLGHGPDAVGQLRFDGLGITAAHEVAASPLARLRPSLLRDALPPRRPGAHKGDHGRLLLVGGGPGMPGAIRLAAEAALRAGAGLVTVATHPDNRTAVTAARPEIICHGVSSPDQIHALIDAADVVAVGPGMGTCAWARELMPALVGCARRWLWMRTDSICWLR